MRARLALTSLACLALPAPVAAVLSEDDPRGDVRSKQLATAQRDAIDLVKVKAVGHKKVGTAVTVTFAGNFDREIARGALEYGAARAAFLPRRGLPATPELVPYASGPRGHAKSPNLLPSAAGATAAVRRDRVVRFWVVGRAFRLYSRMRITTDAGRASLGIPADILKSHVADSRDGCGTARDLLGLARAERGQDLASGADTRHMRRAMARVIEELERRRDAQCAVEEPTPDPSEPPPPDCDVHAKLAQFYDSPGIAVSETCNRAVDQIVNRVADGHEVSGWEGESCSPFGDYSGLYCTMEQARGETTTVQFSTDPTAEAGDQVTVSLNHDSEEIWSRSYTVQP